MLQKIANVPALKKFSPLASRCVTIQLTLQNQCNSNGFVLTVFQNSSVYNVVSNLLSFQTSVFDKDFDEVMFCFKTVESLESGLFDFSY